ncbi:wax ester/triacylglycerol synthase domain-containing protein [Gordonia sp. VNQ95]|uniref:wax ester/triacylglycerol synthase domain-containing protein n=1 Tax=Gordonia sp. VNQ95 TaxID=3156619 RepID=UPI0032B4A81F
MERFSGSERFSGPDALMFNMETPTTPMHTLKVAILDTRRRGRPVTLGELVDVLPDYLGMFPRATQRVQCAPGRKARPFWVADEDFDVADHLDEISLPAPGGRAQLDAALSELAVHQLDRSRALWALTLVHGLAGGRQAVVVRVHHAVADGLAALNTLMAATSEEGGVVEVAPVRRPHTLPSRADLTRSARRESRSLLAAIPRVMSTFARAARIASDTDAAEHIPRPLTVRRTSFNTPSGGERVCASGGIPLADVQRIAVALGTTVNGALHGIIAGAMRSELADRGDDLTHRSVTVFGVCRDLASTRTRGNEIATAAAYMRTDIADPVERITATAESCAAAVGRRKKVGFEMTDRMSTYTGRLAPTFRNLAAHRAPRIMNTITTANMAGPRQTRWVGGVEVIDWISFALAIAPADVNLTTYSYAGTLSMGLIATPESMPDPHRFLRRVAESLDEVHAALSDRGLLGGDLVRGDR